MIALRLVRLIEDHSDELAEDLTQRLLASERSKELRLVPAAELHERSHEVYRHLSDWLMNKTDADIEKVYRKLGGRRAHQGVGLADVVWALFQTKEHLWSFLEREGVHAQPHYLYGEFELLRLLDQFFDRAVYHATAGYEEAVAPKAA
jgi:RsbT co-antagonist protein rsbRD N-terminal domain